jgi:hypothetical protein
MKIRFDGTSARIFLEIEIGFVLGDLLFDIFLGTVFGMGSDYCEPANRIYYIILSILAIVCIILLAFGFQAVQNESSIIDWVFLILGHAVYIIIVIYYYSCLLAGLICKNWSINKITLMLKYLPNIFVSIVGCLLNLILFKYRVQL